MPLLSVQQKQVMRNIQMNAMPVTYASITEQTGIIRANLICAQLLEFGLIATDNINGVMYISATLTGTAYSGGEV